MSKTAYIISTIHRRKLVLLNLPHFPHISHHLWRIYVWKVPYFLANSSIDRCASWHSNSLKRAFLEARVCWSYFHERRRSKIYVSLTTSLVSRPFAAYPSIIHPFSGKWVTGEKLGFYVYLPSGYESQRKSVSRVFRVSLDDKGFCDPYPLPRLIFLNISLASFILV